MPKKQVTALRQQKPNAEAELRVQLKSRRQIEALVAALAPETLHPAGDKAEASVRISGKVLRVTITARDSSALRAIVTSYIRMLKAVSNVFASISDVTREHIPA